MIQYILKTTHMFIFVNALIISERVHKNLNSGELWKVEPENQKMGGTKGEGTFFPVFLFENFTISTY